MLRLLSGATGSLPCEIRYSPAITVGDFAWIRVAFRLLASTELSSPSGSNADSADTAVRNVSIGTAPVGNDRPRSQIAEGTSRFSFSLASSAASSDSDGRRPFHSRNTTSSNVECSARAWIG